MVTHQELVDHMAIGTMCANGHGLADYVATYQHPNDPKNPTGWLEHIPLCTPPAPPPPSQAPPPGHDSPFTLPPSNANEPPRTLLDAPPAKPRRKPSNGWTCDMTGPRVGGGQVNDEWRTQAACRGKPPSWWYPNDGWDSVDDALAVCAGCPVLFECRTYALAHEREGVWGGLTEQERRKVRKRSGIRVVDPVEFDPEPDRARRAVRLWEGGWTAIEIAAELHVAAKSVHRYLEAAGFDTAPPPPDRTKPRRSRERMTQEIAV